MGTSLRAYCDTYFALEARIRRLTREADRIDEQIERLTRHRSSSSGYASQGVANYGQRSGPTGLPGDPTCTIADRHLRAVARLDASIADLIEQVVAKREEIVALEEEIGPYRTAMESIHATDATILTGRFGQGRFARPVSYTAIAAQVDLDESTVREHLTRLREDFPLAVEAARDGVLPSPVKSPDNPREVPVLSPGRQGKQGVLCV